MTRVIRCDVCLREIKDHQRGMLFWETGPNRQITMLLVAHKGGRHQGSLGCDPNFKYSWELSAAIAEGDDFVARMQGEFWVRGWVALKLRAFLGQDVTDTAGEAR